MDTYRQSRPLEMRGRPIRLRLYLEKYGRAFQGHDAVLNLYTKPVAGSLSVSANGGPCWLPGAKFHLIFSDGIFQIFVPSPVTADIGTNSKPSFLRGF
jgi:hypothetical protein